MRRAVVLVLLALLPACSTAAPPAASASAAPGGRGFHVITSSPAPVGPEVVAASGTLATRLRDALPAVEPVSTY